MKLTEAEICALNILKDAGGSMLVTRIPNKNTRGIFNIEPGIRVYKGLEKKGLLFFTEQDSESDDFEWTSDVYITDEGIRVLEECA